MSRLNDTVSMLSSVYILCISEQLTRILVLASRPGRACSCTGPIRPTALTVQCLCCLAGRAGTRGGRGDNRR